MCTVKAIQERDVRGYKEGRYPEPTDGPCPPAERLKTGTRTRATPGDQQGAPACQEVRSAGRQRACAARGEVRPEEKQGSAHGRPPLRQFCLRGDEERVSECQPASFALTASGSSITGQRTGHSCLGSPRAAGTLGASRTGGRRRTCRDPRGAGPPSKQASLDEVTQDQAISGDLMTLWRKMHHLSGGDRSHHTVMCHP